MRGDAGRSIPLARVLGEARVEGEAQLRQADVRLPELGVDRVVLARQQPAALSQDVCAALVPRSTDKGAREQLVAVVSEGARLAVELGRHARAAEEDVEGAHVAKAVAVAEELRPLFEARQLSTHLCTKHEE